MTEPCDAGMEGRARASTAIDAGVPSRGRPLRVGLLLDSLSGAAWIEHVVKRIINLGIAEISLVVLNDSGNPVEGQASGGFARRVRAWYRNRDALAFALYERLDERRYGSTDSPLRRVDLAPLLAAVPVVRVRPRMTRFCDYFEDADIERITAADLDVVLRCGFRILKGGALGIARHGVWSFHHGDNTVNRGGPAGFWEVMEQHVVTGAVLQRLTEELDGGEVLGRSYSSTDRFSATANRANYYWQAAELLVSRLNALAENTGFPRPSAPVTHGWTAYSRRLYTRPRSTEMLRHAAGLAARLVRSKVRSLLYDEQWIMSYRLSPQDAVQSDVPDGVFYRFKELKPPRDRFWADPFPVYASGRHYIFFEEYFYGQPHAHICVVEIDRHGMKGEPRVVLKRPYHLSYPSVFQWEGEWYMTPETATRQAVELYRATRFPDEWEYVCDLVSGVGVVDPTIAQIHGRWWMFVGVTLPGANEATALHIHSAPTPLGPWTPHAGNPVKIDVRGARPGGRVFFDGGRYYRVAQDGAPRYGSALRVFVIDSLDETTYRETEVAHITPAWRRGLAGTHTLNASGGLTTIDVRQVRRRF